MINLNAKTITRIAVIQALYQSINQQNLDFFYIIKQIEELYRSENVCELFEDGAKKYKIKINISMFREIANFANAQKDKIDEYIIKHLSDTVHYNNCSQNLKALLRSAVGEALIFPETPKNVIVDEYTNIAAEMLQEKDIGFVNGIIDKILKEIREHAS